MLWEKNYQQGNLGKSKSFLRFLGFMLDLSFIALCFSDHVSSWPFDIFLFNMISRIPYNTNS